RHRLSRIEGDHVRTTVLFVWLLALSAYSAERQTISLAAQSRAAQPSSTREGPRRGLDSVRRWNKIAIDASGLDHTPVAPGEHRAFGEQVGPGRSSRAMAIVHIAMADTVNAVMGDFQSYTGVRARAGAISMQAAISQAAHDTLSALFPSQAASFDALLAED